MARGVVEGGAAVTLPIDFARRDVPDPLGLPLRSAAFYAPRARHERAGGGLCGGGRSRGRSSRGERREGAVAESGCDREEACGRPEEERIDQSQSVTKPTCRSPGRESRGTAAEPEGAMTALRLSRASRDEEIDLDLAISKTPPVDFITESLRAPKTPSDSLAVGAAKKSTSVCRFQKRHLSISKDREPESAKNALRLSRDSRDEEIDLSLSISRTPQRA